MITSTSQPITYCKMIAKRNAVRFPICYYDVLNCHRQQLEIDQIISNEIDFIQDCEITYGKTIYENQF